MRRLIYISLFILGIICIVFEWQFYNIRNEIFDEKTESKVTIITDNHIRNLYNDNAEYFNKINDFILEKYDKYKFDSIWLPIDYDKDSLDEYKISINSLHGDNRNKEKLLEELRNNADIKKLSSQLKINYIQTISNEFYTVVLYLQKDVLNSRQIGLAYKKHGDLEESRKIDDNWYVWYAKDMHDTIFRNIYDWLFMR